MLCKDHINSAKIKSLHRNRYCLFTHGYSQNRPGCIVPSYTLIPMQTAPHSCLPLQLEKKLFISNSSKGRPPNVHMMYYLSARLCALTMWAMMLSLWREGCRLNRTISPSIRCRSTISPNFSSWAIFSRFPYFKNLIVTHDNEVRRHKDNCK